MPVELTRKSFTPYAAKKGEEYMNAQQRKHFRKILEALKAELDALTKRLAELKEQVKRENTRKNFAGIGSRCTRQSSRGSTPNSCER